MSFAKDLKAFAKKTGNRLDETAVATIFRLNELVVTRTPVRTGRARGSWIPSIGSVDVTAKGGTDKGGSATISRANSVATKALGNVYVLANNLDYIGVLEYGGYPDPPENGSWDKKSGKWVMLSEGGYSRQAPHGMLRISVQELKQFIYDEARK